MTDLTTREDEVLDLLLTGAPNKDIAQSLKIEIVTVKLHMRNIVRKLGARNRTHAALIAQRQRIKQAVTGGNARG